METPSRFDTLGADPRRIRLHDRTATSPLTPEDAESMSDGMLTFARWAASAILSLACEPGNLRVRGEAAELAKLLDREADDRLRRWNDELDARAAEYALPMHPAGSRPFAAGVPGRFLLHAEREG